MNSTEKQWLMLGGLGALAYWLWLTQSGQAAAEIIGGGFSAEPQPPTPAGALPVGLAQSTLQLIAGFELFSATPYRDANGFSIGYGHFMGPVITIQSITPEDALVLLSQDAGNAARAVSEGVTVPLTQNQFDALVSLAYNIGNNAFLGSTLLAKLNAGDYAGAQQQFSRWNKSQGNVLQTLVDRRANEATLFAT